MVRLGRSRRARNLVAKRRRRIRLRRERLLRTLKRRLPRTAWVTSVAWVTIRTVLVVALPFLLLVRGSVTAHRMLGTNGWLSILLGALLATIYLAFSGAWLWRKLTGRDRFRGIARNLAIPLVVAFCLYSLGWLSSLHAKSPEIRALYGHLHPSLRLAIGTAILADPHVVITEIKRSHADYARMGLTPVDDSLHFEQPDGWIHAVDLRTRGRGDLHNGISSMYFRMMGFHALRHGGTGDHLHVSLPRSRSRSR